MAKNADLKTFVGYQELTGKKFFADSLASAIGKFSSADLLTVGARLNYLVSYPLLTPAHREFNPEPVLASAFLQNSLNRLQLLIRGWPESRRVFSRQQGLTLLNLAVRFGSKMPGQATGTPEGQANLGEILLKINDSLFSDDQLRNVRSKDDVARQLAVEQQLGFLMELYNPGGFETAMFRVDVMLRELFAKRPTTSLQDLFISRRGVPVLEYRDLLLALVAYYVSTQPADVLKQPGRVVIQPDVFCQGNAIPVDRLRAVMAAESKSAAAHLEWSPENEGRAEQDFSRWRRFPFLTTADGGYQCVDPAILIEKFGSGFRWTLVNACVDRAERKTALAAFGELSEGYCDWLLRTAEPSLGGVLLSFPEFASSSEEAFDGLLVGGDYALALEYKLGTMPTAATTSVDSAELLRQTAKIFGVEGGRKLAARMEAVFAADSSKRRAIQGADTDGIRRVTPVFIVYDPFWRFSLAARHAAAAFDQALATGKLRADVRYDPCVIIDLEALEATLGSVTPHFPLTELVRSYQEVRNRYLSFREWLRSGRALSLRGDWPVLVARLKEIWNGVGQRYFGTDVW